MVRSDVEKQFLLRNDHATLGFLATFLHTNGIGLIFTKKKNCIGLDQLTSFSMEKTLEFERCKIKH